MNQFIIDVVAVNICLKHTKVQSFCVSHYYGSRAVVLTVCRPVRIHWRTAGTATGTIVPTNNNLCWHIRNTHIRKKIFFLRIYIYTQFFWDSLYRVSYILGIYISGIEPVTEGFEFPAMGPVTVSGRPAEIPPRLGGGKDKI